MRNEEFVIIVGSDIRVYDVVGPFETHTKALEYGIEKITPTAREWRISHMVNQGVYQP